MANLTEVQLPNGTTYKLVDDESGYITEAEVEGMIGDKADKTLVSYCSCSTAAATAQKEVVAPEGWVLESGRIIAVKFVNTNTAQNPTLKVGTADAKSIYYNNAVVTTGSLFAGGEADRVTLYIYDGTRFVWLGHSIDNNTTYSAMSVSELTTGTATSLRTVRADYLKTGINTLVSGKADKTDIATVESDTTASRAYSVGELLYYNGTLHKAKVPIASGAAFTEGTNVEPAKVSDSISNIIGDISRLKGDIQIPATITTENAFCREIGRVVATIPNNSSVTKSVLWANHYIYSLIATRRSVYITGLLSCQSSVLSFSYTITSDTVSGIKITGTAI